MGKFELFIFFSTALLAVSSAETTNATEIIKIDCVVLSGDGPFSAGCDNIIKEMQGNKHGILDFKKDLTCESCTKEGSKENCRNITIQIPKDDKDTILNCAKSKEYLQIHNFTNIECAICGAASVAATLCLIMGTAFSHLLNHVK